MIDINSIISLALTSAINKAIEPLLERIDSLEKNEDALVRRIAVLETVDPTATPATITADAFVTHLDQQEWFWDKLARFVVNNGGSVVADDLAQIKERVTALEGDISHKVQVQQANITAALAERIAALESETQGENRYLNRDDVASLIEEAMDEHTSNYDHDDYDNHINDDDKHFEGDIEDAVRDTVRNMSFEVTLS